MTPRPSRVLVVDDSRTAREVIRAILEAEPDFQVIGTAATGREAIEMAAALRPDLITLDLVLPDLDGLEVARQVVRQVPTRVLIVSRVLDRDDLHSSFQALEAGALDVLHKGPLITAQGREHLQAELLAKARAVASARPVSTLTSHPAQARTAGVTPRPVRLVVFASSTGGPVVLRQTLAALPADFCAPLLVVQHLTPGFEQGMADWLSAAVPFQVRVAQTGDRLQPGVVLLAPHGHQLALTPSGAVALQRSEPGLLHCPSADVTLADAARHYRCGLVAVVLSGLGSDAAEGLAAVRAQGGVVIAQQPATCAAPSMPRTAVDRGLPHLVLAPGQIGPALTAITRPAACLGAALTITEEVRA